MRKTPIFVTLLLLTPLIIFLLANVVAGFSKTIYVLETTYYFENITNETVTVVFDEKNIKEFIVPNIEGWQTLKNYTIFLNGIDITGKCVLKSYKNNKIITIPPYFLKPGKKLNVTIIQVIEAEWAENGLTLSRRVKSSSILENNPYSTSINSSALTFLGDFWTKQSGEASWSEVLELKRRIDNNSSSLPEYVFKVSDWVSKNINYSLKNFAINYPAKTIHEREGACGDKSALIVALLRLKGVPSFMYFAIVYNENLSLSENSSLVSLNYQNFALHAFAMVCTSETCVPIDTTIYADVGKCPYIDGAGVNISDKIIVLAQISDMNPNDVLMLTLPSTNVRVSILKILKRKHTYEGDIVFPIAAVVVFSCVTWLFSRNLTE